MVTLLLVAVSGVVMAFFATQNTESVTLKFLDYTTPQIPIYLVVLTPFIVGILLSLLFHTVRDISQSLAIKSKEDKLRELKKNMGEVTKELHVSQIENAKLKTKKGETEVGDSF